ncbi:MAG TPA: peptidylprolyl isomerase [Actinocatenispora sp.]
MEPSAGAPLPGDQSASSGYEPQSGARPSWQSGGGPPPYGQPPYPTPGGPPPGGPHYPTPAYGAEPPRRSRAWIGWLVGACAVVLVLCCGGGGLVAYHYWSADGDSTPHGPGPSHGPTGSAASGACRYPSDGQQPAREVRTPDPESAVPTTATLVTNRGTITVRLAADKAPCTLRSLASLARQGFYDDSPCHRLTTRGLWIVQCGDPSGTGRGGPGYTVPDENMPTGGGIAYPRGTVALANTGESGTGGSQFFICYRDDDLPPSYAVVGTVSAGMSVVDGVAAGGEVDETGPGDGKPRLPLTITSMTTH